MAVHDYTLVCTRLRSVCIHGTCKVQVKYGQLVVLYGPARMPSDSATGLRTSPLVLLQNEFYPRVLMAHHPLYVHNNAWHPHLRFRILGPGAGRALPPWIMYCTVEMSPPNGSGCLSSSRSTSLRLQCFIFLVLSVAHLPSTVVGPTPANRSVFG